MSGQPQSRLSHFAILCSQIPSHLVNLQVILGGRDVEQSYDDLWAFDLSSLEWEEWGRDSPEKPSMRNHLGGFASEELIYIYGEFSFCSRLFSICLHSHQPCKAVAMELQRNVIIISV